MPTGNEQTWTQSRFFKSETLTLNFCRSLDYARGYESIIYFIDLCKPIETFIYARKKHPFTSYPVTKHPKHSRFAIIDIREKPVNFFYCSTRASTLVSAIILLTQAPLRKFPFLFIILWSDQGIINCKGTGAFAQEPELAKLLWRLKLTLVLNNKKSSLVFLVSL